MKLNSTLSVDHSRMKIKKKMKLHEIIWPFLIIRYAYTQFWLCSSGLMLVKLSQKEKSLAPKLTPWRRSILQNSNGHGGLNFWTTPFKFWILEISLCFEAVKMILLYLIKISFSFRYKKNENEFFFPSSRDLYDLHCRNDNNK